MFMREVVFRNWKFEVDSELTRKSFANESNGASDTCNCDYCKNFREQRESIFPEEIRILFIELGIDFRKEGDATEICKLENGLHNYIGYFHFAGEILTGKTFDSEEYSGPELLQISENFSVCFGEKKGKQWVKVLFETNIPWILEEKEDLLDIRAAQKEEANAPTISLSEMKKEFGIQ